VTKLEDGRPGLDLQQKLGFFLTTASRPVLVLFNGYPGLLLWGLNGQSIHLHLVARLGMHGDIHLLPQYLFMLGA